MAGPGGRGFQGAQPWKGLESEVMKKHVRAGSAEMPELDSGTQYNREMPAGDSS